MKMERKLIDLYPRVRENNGQKNISQILQIHTLIVITLKSINELQCTDLKKKSFFK